jgi:hypothetical protein
MAEGVFFALGRLCLGMEMSKTVTLKFLGDDPHFTNAKLFLDGKDSGWLYVDEPIVLELDAVPTEIFVRVYGFKSETLVISALTDIEYIEVEYFCSNLSTLAGGRHFWLPELLLRTKTWFEEVIVFLRFLMYVQPDLDEVAKRGLLRLTAYRRKHLE